MLSCNGCLRKYTYFCKTCVGWNKYESDTLINPVLAMDIDKEMRMLAKHTLNKLFGVESLERRENNMTIKKVYFNDPVTVVLWEDGTKTIVRSGDGDIYDDEKGLAMAIAKKALGNKGNYYEVFKKWLPEDPVEKMKRRLKEIEDYLEVAISATEEIERFEKEDNLEWLSVKEVAEANGLSVKCVRKQIKDGFIPLAEKVNGKWKIPCYVFDDHVEVKCV